MYFLCPTITVLEAINQLMRPLFCPQSVEHEQKLSLALPSLLKSNCSSPLDDACLSTTKSDLATIRRTKCKTVTNFEKKVTEWKSYIEQKLNSSQVNELVNVGFCMETTPNTARIAIGRENIAMMVCAGVIGPSSNANEFYLPTEKVLVTDMRRMKGILSGIVGIELMTIARSNRDGFVPRKLQPTIERQLLQLVRASNGQRNIKTEVVYDRNLMKSKAHSKCVM